jgi:lysophospholipid acyltransferase (LPLAT)-like uncharacterized protein
LCLAENRLIASTGFVNASSRRVDLSLFKLEGSEMMEENNPTESATQPASAESISARRAARGKYNLDIDNLRRRVYAFAPLSQYRPGERVLIRLADVFFYLLIKIICSTLRWETRGMEHSEAIRADGKRVIIAFWHSCIFSGTWFWRKRGIVVMSSQSRDGAYIERFIKRFGYGAAKGSATRGGARALILMAHCLESGIDVAFPIDGPRGPVYVAKPGAVTLARHTGQAILPFHVAARRSVELPTWDRLQIPLPFTRALALIAAPVYVPLKATNQEASAKQAQLQASLDRLRAEAQAWRDEPPSRRDT